MSASKALLASSLAVTFASGAFVGHVGSRDQAPQLPSRQSVEFVYYEHFQDMRAAGYDEAEIGEAREIYQDYMKSYRRWWDSVLNSMPETVEAIDNSFYLRRDKLRDRVQLRLGKPTDKGPDQPGK